MEMKMMLSIPRTISNANSVAKAIQDCGSVIQSTDGIPPRGYQSAPHHISSHVRARTLSVVVKAGFRAGGGGAWGKRNRAATHEEQQPDPGIPLNRRSDSGGRQP